MWLAAGLIKMFKRFARTDVGQLAAYYVTKRVDKGMHDWFYTVENTEDKVTPIWDWKQFNMFGFRRKGGIFNTVKSKFRF
jgi:hypothetical protein